MLDVAARDSVAALPRVASRLRRSPTAPSYLMIHVDSFSRSPGRGGLPELAHRTNPPGRGCLYTPIDAGDIAHFRETSAIYGIELPTVVAAISSLRYCLKWGNVAIYVDNNAALAALIKAPPPSRMRVSSPLCVFSVSLNIAVWMDRVSSDVNIADRPSIGISLPFPLHHSRRFELPAAQYCADYIINILQNVRDSRKLISLQSRMNDLSTSYTGGEPFAHQDRAAGHNSE